jgi:chemotaxis signal transduction protein
MSGACAHVSVADEHYAVAVEHVLEVAKLGDLTAVPGASPWLLGVINRDGQVLPVLDLAKLLGTRSTGRPACLLVVEDGARRAGLAVEEILDVRPAPATIDATESKLLRGAALVEGLLVGMLEIGAVLDKAAYCDGDGHAR